MIITNLKAFLRYFLFAALLGAIINVIVNGTIALAAYNIESFDRGLVVSVFIWLAPILATAPLIEWWYNFLHKLLRIESTGTTEDTYETEHQAQGDHDNARLHHRHSHYHCPGLVPVQLVVGCTVALAAAAILFGAAIPTRRRARSSRRRYGAHEGKRSVPELGRRRRHRGKR